MILYEGPSELDGKPIVVILTGLSNKSKNSKTGEMPQIWILRADIHPTEALKTGEDSSICGSCPHRPKQLGDDALKKHNRTCYVSVMGPNAIYKKYQLGNYERCSLEKVALDLTGQKVRLGAYGDPAAVPIAIWDTILVNCTSTGYTHQWRTCDRNYAKYLQASCDDLVDVVESTALGYRTFFVQKVNTIELVTREHNGIKFAHCPASKEKGKVTTCSQCMACSGTRSGLKSNITIMMH